MHLLVLMRLTPAACLLLPFQAAKRNMRASNSSLPKRGLAPKTLDLLDLHTSYKAPTLS